jgi:nucleoside-diphosphate-sugar epimerase
MIIGSGMLARAFSAYAEHEDIVILAAGISNSRELRSEAYERELNLVERTISSIADRQLVYFSTCSIYDPDTANSPYVLHKLNVENMISDAVANFTLFRLPQVVGGNANSKTLISF